MERKKPVWTKAMRKQAALHGARQSRESRQYAGLVSWFMKTPEEQAAAVARLQARRPTKADFESEEAKAAQAARARAQGKAREVMSARQAAFLADRGMLKRVPIDTPAAPVAIAPPVYAAAAPTIPAPGITLEESGRRARLMATKPEWADYPSLTAYQEAMVAWRRELLGR